MTAALKGHFEAKKHAVRQTQDGWVVSFVVHPNDMTPEFATAPLGTRLMVGYAEIRDDETPAETAAAPVKQNDFRTDAARERGRQSYALSDAMEKARTRAVLLCKDVKFRKWIARDIPEIAIASVDMAEDILRSELRIQSRREIATNERAFRAFVAMESEYLSATGQMAEQRG